MTMMITSHASRVFNPEHRAEMRWHPGLSCTRRVFRPARIRAPSPGNKKEKAAPPQFLDDGLSCATGGDHWDARGHDIGTSTLRAETDRMVIVLTDAMK